MKSTYKCIMSYDSKYIAKMKSRTISICDAMDSKIEYAKIKTKDVIIEFCFTMNSRGLSVLLANGTLSTYDFRQEGTLTEKSQIKIEKRWRNSSTVYAMFYVTESDILITPFDEKRFANDIVLVNTISKQQQLLYQSNYMFHSVTLFKDNSKLFIVETTTLVNPLPARFLTVNLSSINGSQLTPRILFERSIDSKVNLPSAIINDDASIVVVSDGNYLEKYEQVDGAFKLICAKEAPYHGLEANLFEMMKLGDSNYMILMNSADGFYIASMENMTITKKYVRVLNSIRYLSISPSGKYAFFPIYYEKQPNGKIVDLKMFMADIDKLIEGQYDEYFKVA